MELAFRAPNGQGPIKDNWTQGPSRREFDR